MPARIPTDSAKIKAYCNRWGIREFALFGSVLREDFGPESDIDVLISFHPDTDWDYWNWPDMLDELKSIFGRKIDLVVKEALRHPYRGERILAEHEVVHAA